MNIDYDLIQSLGIQALAYERSSIERCKTVFQDAVVFDVGAHTGLWSHAALQAGAKNVICFDEAVYGWREDRQFPLMQNLSSFPDKYDIVFAHICDKEEGFIEDGPPNFTIDRWIEDNDIDPTFIKMDIEGHEVQAIRGAEKTLRRCKPSMMIEAHYGGKDMIINLIKSYTGLEPSGENWILSHIHHIYYLPKFI